LNPARTADKVLQHPRPQTAGAWRRMANGLF
jgi:hypothetical protein